MRDRIDEALRQGDLEPLPGETIARVAGRHSVLLEEQNARQISHGDGPAYAGLCPSGALGSGAAGVAACGADAGPGMAVGGVETVGGAEAAGVVAAVASGAATACLPFRLRFLLGSVMLDSVKHSSSP